MTDPGEHTVATDERVCDSRDKQVGLRWPSVVDAHLDRLLANAYDSGERTNRKELLAAIVATSQFSGEDLRSMLQNYRLMRVRDLLPPSQSDEGVIRLSANRPGPRRARNG